MEKIGPKPPRTFTWFDQPVFRQYPGFTRELLILGLILILALVSRFAILGDRVMAHDEVNHVVPAYNLYKGSGYLHDPLTHGPFQFHMLALSYFLLGDSDFSARVPAALFSIASILVVLFGLKRYLGRAGALIGGFLFSISPLILFYGRYTRNEAIIELFAVLTLYGILRYYEKRDSFSLYLLAVVTALQFATKETAFIYSAQLLLFCGFDFLRELWNLDWRDNAERTRAALIVLCSLLFLLSGFLLYEFGAFSTNSSLFPLAIFAVSAGAILLIYWFVYMIRRFQFQTFRQLTSFNLIIFIGAIILPQLAAFPVSLLGWDPLDYSQAGMIRTGSVLVVFLVVSFLIGIWWNRDVYLKAAAAFYLIFITFFTTFFSNGHGFFTGIIGSLGYWLSQHSVQRGGQPLYYYGAVLLPIYEFAAIAGMILAIYYAIRYRLGWTLPGDLQSESITVSVSAEENHEREISECAPREEEETNFDNLDSVEFNDMIYSSTDDHEIENIAEKPGYFIFRKVKQRKVPTFLLFFFWAVSGLIAYSVAGEKMPWLGVHIAMPIALTAAWGLGLMVERAPWGKICAASGWIGLGCLIVGTYALGGVHAGLFGISPAFQGKELNQLKATNQFVFALISLALAVVILIKTWRKWQLRDMLYTVVLYSITLLCVLQARTAYQSSFINYDYANELLVYAHAAPGPKIVLNQVEEIAARTGQGKTIKVAYDNDARYPYWWYFRDYVSRWDFNDQPTRTLRDYHIIIANTSKDSQLQPIVQNAYERYETMRLWWPNQDYFNLTPSRVWNALMNPAMRSALVEIWLNRDYSKYAQVTQRTSFSPETWDPSAKMVVYIRKDVLSKMWQLGDATLSKESDISTGTFFEDERFVHLEPISVLGSQGTGNGQFNGPRGVAVAPDGDVYVLDSDNNRVQRFTAGGTFLTSWDAKDQGGLNQPWGIAIDRDGNVFIADTWNHRVMKFTGEGAFLFSFHTSDPTEPERMFYGPRSIAIDTTGRLFISDTGNKQIVIYDTSGKFIGRFGSAGMREGEFDEPVGVAVWKDQLLAVADTWNQRVQIFDISAAKPPFPVVTSFPIAGWYSQSLENKPYIAFDADGNILITDPEGALVWQYTQEGNLIRSWNGGGGLIDNPAMPVGIAVDAEGAVWVTNTRANQINQFILPAVLPNETDQ